MLQLRHVSMDIRACFRNVFPLMTLLFTKLGSAISQLALGHIFLLPPRLTAALFFGPIASACAMIRSAQWRRNLYGNRSKTSNQ